MFIECAKNNGTDYLRLVEGYSFTENGKQKHRRRIVRNIGPLARFDDGYPDYLQRLRQSFSDGKPIIALLTDYTSATSQTKKLMIPFDPAVDDDCFSTPKNIGYFLLDALYDALGIYDVLSLHKSRHGIDYDLNGNAKLLVFGRALFPDSKLGTFEGRENYLFPVTKSEKVAELYATLDELHKKAEAIQKRLNLKIRQSVGRASEVCFYDVTNYYFEIGENDGAEGLRKKGVSKENRQTPIVQMGLFLDDNGIPISYQLFPGNQPDQTTLRPAMTKTIDNMHFDRVIIVADGGLKTARTSRISWRAATAILFPKVRRRAKSLLRRGCWTRRITAGTTPGRSR